MPTDIATRIVLVGSGHAHGGALARLQRYRERGFDVTVVAPAAAHHYSGMGPGMLGGIYRPDEITLATRQIVEAQGARFLADEAIRVEASRRVIHLRSGGSVSYDVASFNTGSVVPRELVSGEGPGRDVFTVKPIEFLARARERIMERCAEPDGVVGIVGGGPSAAEIAGNIVGLVNAHRLHAPRVVVFSSSPFMKRFTPRVRRLVRSSLAERGVEIRDGIRVSSVTHASIATEDGETTLVDIAILAVGLRPTRLFADSGLPVGPDGGLLVNRYLQCVDHPEIFGGGDCVHFVERPLAKEGVYAIRQAPVLARNIEAAATGRPLRPFRPGGPYLLIFNLGDGIGVLSKRWLTCRGRTAFALKDWIDRRYVASLRVLTG